MSTTAPPTTLAPLTNLSCPAICQFGGLTDTTLTQNCDVGSQLYCNDTTNITTAKCTEYLKRVNNTINSLKLGSLPNVNLTPTYTDNRQYYRDLVSKLDTACGTQSQITSDACVATINIFTAPTTTSSTGTDATTLGVLNSDTTTRSAQDFYATKRNAWYTAAIDKCVSTSPTCTLSTTIERITGLTAWVDAQAASAVSYYTSATANPLAFYTNAAYKNIYTLYKSKFKAIDDAVATYINYINLALNSNKVNTLVGDIIDLAFGSTTTPSNSVVKDALINFITNKYNAATNHTEFYDDRMLYLFDQMKLKVGSTTTTTPFTDILKNIATWLNDDIAKLNTVASSFDTALYTKLNSLTILTETQKTNLKSYYNNFCNSTTYPQNVFNAVCSPQDETMKKSALTYCLTNNGKNDTTNCGSISTLDTKISGMKNWLISKTKNIVTLKTDGSGSIESINTPCDDAGGLTIETCQKICDDTRYTTDLCKADQIQRCSDPINRYSSTAGFNNKENFADESNKESCCDQEYGYSDSSLEFNSYGKHEPSIIMNIIFILFIILLILIGMKCFRHYMKRQNIPMATLIPQEKI